MSYGYDVFLMNLLRMLILSKIITLTSYLKLTIKTNEPHYIYVQSHLNFDHERVTYAARGLRVNISGRPRVTVLQLLNVCSYACMYVCMYVCMYIHYILNNS